MCFRNERDNKFYKGFRITKFGNKTSMMVKKYKKYKLQQYTFLILSTRLYLQTFFKQSTIETEHIIYQSMTMHRMTRMQLKHKINAYILD